MAKKKPAKPAEKPRKPNPLYTVEGLEAAKKRRGLNAAEKKRLSSYKAANEKRELEGFKRRVKYALGRKKPLPKPTNKKQEKIIEREKLERAYNPPRQRTEEQKLRRKYKLKSRKWKGKYQRQATRIYDIPFNYSKAEGLKVSRSAIKGVYLTERLNDIITDNEQKLRRLHAAVYVKFRNKLTRMEEDEQGDEHKVKLPMENWVPVPYPYLASDDSWDQMADDIETLIARYEISNVYAVEVTASY